MTVKTLTVVVEVTVATVVTLLNVATLVAVVKVYTMYLPGHRVPLYFIPGSVSQRLARTLLKGLLSKNEYFNTQFTHASRHQGA